MEGVNRHQIFAYSLCFFLSVSLWFFYHKGQQRLAQRIHKGSNKAEIKSLRILCVSFLVFLCGF
ncbi:MAG: hypothetical protein WKF97_25530, partial [Chitinophagaceae bacterium]